MKSLGNILSHTTMGKYFIHNGVKEEGPFTFSELRLKGIKADTPIWYDGLSNWTVASLIPELKPLLEVKKTPPPFKPVKETPPKISEAPEKKQGKSSMKVYLIVLVVALAIFGYTVSRSDDASLPAVSKEEAPVDSTETDTTGTQNTAEKDKERALETDKMIARNQWAKFVSAKPDDYKSNDLGGISELEAVVINNLDYPLDEVKVAVKYIKENGDVFKTEYVKIYNVPANGKASMPAPNSNRGTSVEMEVVAAHSKALDFCYDADMDYVSTEDPYHCN